MIDAGVQSPNFQINFYRKEVPGALGPETVTKVLPAYAVCIHKFDGGNRPRVREMHKGELKWIFG
jgi:hypothetical protein